MFFFFSSKFCTTHLTWSILSLIVRCNLISKVIKIRRLWRMLYSRDSQLLKLRVFLAFWKNPCAMYCSIYWQYNIWCGNLAKLCLLPLLSTPLPPFFLCCLHFFLVVYAKNITETLLQILCQSLMDHSWRNIAVGVLERVSGTLS